MIMELNRFGSLNQSSFVNDSSRLSCDEIPSTVISNISINPDEIDLEDSDADEDVKDADPSSVDAVATTTDDTTEDTGATSLSSMSEEDGEIAEGKISTHQFKSPIRIAARFSMNLPSPVNPLSSTPLRTSDAKPLESEMTCSPVSSSDSDAGIATRCIKRQSDTDSEISDSQTKPVIRQFKRRNQSFYTESGEDT
uniref:Uncharacterized protein n=1 Tax=Ciona savignyi TaxID=51511 RepID=H2Z5J1_CIOSA